MRRTILLIVAATLIGAPTAIAQTTTGTPNSGAGVKGMPGNKSGPAIKGNDSGNQSSGATQDTSKVQGMPGNKSGPPAEKPSKNKEGQ